MPNANEFREAIFRLFEQRTAAGDTVVIVIAGDLHRKIGGYPGSDHCMPTCCSAMREAMQPARGDRVVCAPPKGNGASLTVRYILPRD